MAKDAPVMAERRQCDVAKDALTASSWGSWLAGTAGIDTNTIDSLSKKATAKLSDVSKQLETAKETMNKNPRQP